MVVTSDKIADGTSTDDVLVGDGEEVALLDGVLVGDCVGDFLFVRSRRDEE